jgi:hypothetical protein
VIKSAQELVTSVGRNIVLCCDIKFVIFWVVTPCNAEYGCGACH